VWLVLLALLACGADQNGDSNTGSSVGSSATGGGSSTKSTGQGASTASGGQGGSTGTGQGGSTGQGGAGGKGESCTSIQLGSLLDVDTEAGGSSLAYELTGLNPNETHVLYLEFYDVAGPQIAGSYPLGQSPDDNYSSCAHCLLAFENFSIKSPTPFFATAGSMTVTTADTMFSGKSAGSLKDVVFREATLEGTKTVLVPDGRCLLLEQAQWDTTSS